MNEADPFDPVGAYVRPIRSVLFIDDQFPNFAEASSTAFSEAPRARSLWLACTQLGWLCDIDNSADWSSPERKRRLAACDLLVLDLHLAGQDSRPALTLIRELALSESPNIVVIYTADKNLDQVLISVASAARGASLAAFAVELEPEIETMEIDWSIDDILSFIAGGQGWMKSYAAACKREDRPVEKSTGEALLERWIARSLGVPPHERLVSIDGFKCAERRWFQCGNLFVVVIGKPTEQISEQEASVVLTGLEAAVRDWNPSWLACLVASSRRSVESGSFRDDVNLPPKPLLDGLLRYILGSDDSEERARRAREIASHLLTRRFDYAAGNMSEQLRRRAEAVVVADNESPEDNGGMELLHLNAFLCSERFNRHHLRVGTIFRTREAGPYWVCVTPGCDMVPRKPSVSVNPWAAEMHPSRPLTALRLEIRRGKEIVDSLEKAERGRHIFFFDLARQPSTPIVAACFNTITDDPNPRLEQMFAHNCGLVENNEILLQRCVRDAQSNTIVLESVACEVVSQLRAPYAERLTHVVGHHLSRIGVNFSALPTSAAVRRVQSS